MKLLLLIAGVFAIASSCTNAPAFKLPCEVAAQLPEVEAEVYRQGFTCAHLPPGTRVGAEFLFDNFFSEDQLLEQRRCSFSTHAVSFSVAEGVAVFVFADEKHRKEGAAHLAGLTEDGTLWANESYVSISDAEFTKLPTSSTIKSRRAECARH